MVQRRLRYWHGPLQKRALTKSARVQTQLKLGEVIAGHQFSVFSSCKCGMCYKPSNSVCPLVNSVITVEVTKHIVKLI